MSRRGSSVWALLLCSLGSGCKCANAPSTESQAVKHQDAQALAALGYLDYSPEPADARLMGVTHHAPKHVSPGYNVLTVFSHCEAWVMDSDGTVVWRYRQRPCRQWSHATLLDDGDILVPGIDHTRRLSRRAFDDRRYLLRLGWNGRKRWKRAIAAHHDAEQIPGGDILTLTLGHRRVKEVNTRYDVVDNLVVQLNKHGKTVREVSLYDALSTNDIGFSLMSVSPRIEHRRRVIDLLHANSVEMMKPGPLENKDAFYSRRHVLVSLRHQDAVVALDWPAGKLLWAWGQGELSGPHDAQLLANGNILIFDNGLKRGWSRVVEVNPLTKQIVWQYRAPNPKDFFTPGRGSSQRLANGNTLIAESSKGHAFEVTPEGTVVWDYWLPLLNAQGHRATIVRIERFDGPWLRALVQKSKN